MKYGICDDSGNLLAQFTVPLTVKSNEPVSFSDTLSLKRYVRSRGSQRWEIEAGVEPLKSTANELFVNLVTHGYHTPMKVLIPQNIAIHLYNENNIVAISNLAAGAKGSDSVSMPTFVGKLVAGTFIKFSGHNKIYMVKETLERAGTLKVYPKLRATFQNNKVIYEDVIMNAYYDTDTIQGMVYQDGILMDVGTVKLVEALD